MIQPLVVRILERSRQATHWQMDETRWLVFAEVEGKEGHQGWLWVVANATLVHGGDEAYERQGIAVRPWCAV